VPLRQTYANQLNDPILAANSINTFTGPQNLIRATGNGAFQAQPCIIPANYLKNGSTFRTEAFGSFSTTGTPTIVFGVYTGVTTTYTALAVNSALTTASGAVTLPWHLRVVTQVRSTANPAIMTAISQGELWYGTTLTATTQIPIPGTALATTNTDNSVAIEWAVCATYSASSASNIIVLHYWSVEELTQM
jgi:hypothetical protein